jgi:hypothetical protein
MGLYQPQAKYGILALMVLPPAARERVVIARMWLGSRGTCFLEHDQRGREHVPVRWFILGLNRGLLCARVFTP